MPSHHISQDIWGDVSDVAARNPCSSVAQNSPATRYAWVVSLLRAADGRERPTHYEAVRDRAALLWATALQRHLADDGCPGRVCLRTRGITSSRPTLEDLAERWKETIPATLQNTIGMLGELTRLQESAGVPLTFFAELTPERPDVRYFTAGVDTPIKHGFRSQPAPQPDDAAEGARTFILTWNPDTEGWPEADYRRAVARSERGQITKERWSVGSRTGGISPGDRAFMLRQRRERGIVASGRFASEVFEDEHWADPKRTATYAEVDWDRVLDYGDRLPTELLEQAIPGAHWAPQGSGTELRPPASAQLEALWERHTRPLPRLWCVRAGSQAEAAEEFVRDGVVAIGWHKIGDPRALADAEELKAAVEREYPEEATGSHQAAGSFRRFLSEMSVGDLVLTPSAGTVHIGRVDGESLWDASRGRFPTHRRVKWTGQVTVESLPRPGRDSLAGRLAVFEIQDRGLRRHLLDPIAGPRPPAPHDPLARLAAELLVPSESLAEMVELLADKGQVIFYGPPGTGKTYIARKLAAHLCGDDDHVELVQFHPSYAYEDFVEGFRPAADGGSGFALAPGPLKRLARRAEADPDHTYVLVIDEINRGNVARVFGELYFLLDYRSERITLQYSAEPFRLPANLRIIATMNTADRSIGLLDAALRRRFYFFGFFPDTDPVKGLLRRWLERHHPDLGWVADRVDRANDQLKDRDAAIGPSYFMGKGAMLDGRWVEIIWKRSVLPYIEERLFGERDRLPSFSLDALGRAGAAAPADLESDANADA